jgi:hypothetical protein
MGAKGPKARTTKRTHLDATPNESMALRTPFGQPNKAKLSKDTGQGPGAKWSENKNGETNPIRT